MKISRASKIRLFVFSFLFGLVPISASAKENPVIPIIMFHHIRDYQGKDVVAKKLSIHPAALEKDVEWLENNGYETIDLDQMLKVLNGSLTLEKKPVVLTFDDGYQDAFTEAFPILEKHHAKGVFYLPSGLLNHHAYMTDEEVKKMDEEGMMIAAHTVSHAALDLIHHKKRIEELSQSKDQLEKIVGHEVVHLAYPYGEYNADTIEVAKSLGYKTATTTHLGAADGSADLFRLPRIRVNDKTNIAHLMEYWSTHPGLLVKTRQ